MNWHQLTEISQLEELVALSQSQKVLILKHSTRCSISSMALSRLERSWDDGNGISAYYLDLIQYRNVSNAIAEKFNIEHQSPQVLVLDKGEVVYTASHMGISYSDIVA
ncbi:bacillithiol system redox-active protein YtxJ [Flammeovirga sp. EKP202]|uniref:bacillithiol system redox-active protein YtxJ n=1 Tax=Flammeovirga sp. EKP202 TaxID=2770592 RepID=UPI00165FC76B|nr:bacillithiol system redox-active protein YtxJ [Flammeovirga sp. EKP202]MBD0402607.1 bacillithiol system redox-active protein YtxJ [Flammeovirga sp. EKP202]